VKVFIKLILRKFFIVPSFCKICGRDVHDFIAPDKIWGQIEPHIKYGNVVCYDCFCEICKKEGLKSVWEIK